MADDNVKVLPLDSFDPTGNWICYGPSESGKTTFARHIMERMVKELHIPRENIFVFCDPDVQYQHDVVPYKLQYFHYVYLLPDLHISQYY